MTATGAASVAASVATAETKPAKPKQKSLVAEAREVARAIELIELGARLQVLESETTLSRERLLRLYKEVAGKSPAKGMLPFSTDWFMTWQPSIHSSLFFNIYSTLLRSDSLETGDALAKAYRLYLEHLASCNLPAVLSLTRAWRLVKFFEAGMLDTTECTECHGRFVTHKYEIRKTYVCGLCDMPARAGKTRETLAARRAAEAAAEAADD